MIELPFVSPKKPGEEREKSARLKPATEDNIASNDHKDLSDVGWSVEEPRTSCSLRVWQKGIQSSLSGSSQPLSVLSDAREPLPKGGPLLCAPLLKMENTYRKTEPIV